MTKSFAWFFLLNLFLLILGSSVATATAQTEPTATPAPDYPPPATPSQPAAAYPSQGTPTNGGDNTPNLAPTRSFVEPTRSIGSDFVEENAEVGSSSLPISTGTILRNRVILWAGFLITLLIFVTAVYGAMLMYTRRRG